MCDAAFARWNGSCSAESHGASNSPDICFARALALGACSNAGTMNDRPSTLQAALTDAKVIVGAAPDIDCESGHLSATLVRRQ